MINLTLWRLVVPVVPAVLHQAVLQAAGEAGQTGQAGPHLPLLGHHPEQGLDPGLRGSLLLQGLQVEESQQGGPTQPHHHQAQHHPARPLRAIGLRLLGARPARAGGAGGAGDVEGGGRPQDVAQVADTLLQLGAEDYIVVTE